MQKIYSLFFQDQSITQPHHPQLTWHSTILRVATPAREEVVGQVAGPQVWSYQGIKLASQDRGRFYILLLTFI